MRKQGLFVLGLMFVAAFVALAPTTQAQDDPEVITIEADPVALAYKQTEFKLAKDTTYNITFVNLSTSMAHNLIIDVNDDVSSSNLDDSNDVHIGTPNDDASGVDYTASVLWTTPNEDTVITYFCGYSGHYDAGMKGEFTIGEGASSPGFGLFFALSAVVMIAIAVPRLRRN
jgi:uncharacterized cupredoxin-like copper-binding protein